MPHLKLPFFAALLTALALGACQRSSATPAPAPTPPQPTSTSGVDWQPYDTALATAKAAQKPVCLVFTADWCPHCRNYKKVFEDPKVVELSRRFVMVRVDVDKEPQVSARYGPDGTYVPRTYFLSSKGDLDLSIHAPRPNYQYFYDENAPASVLAGMTEALSKLN